MKHQFRGAIELWLLADDNTQFHQIQFHIYGDEIFRVVGSKHFRINRIYFVQKFYNSHQFTYCDMFDLRLPLLGNRSRNIFMDTLTTPVLLRFMVINSGRASVSIVAGSVKEGKTIHRVSPRPSAFEVSLGQSVFGVSQCSSVSP
jgi:hypothetical protein